MAKTYMEIVVAILKAIDEGCSFTKEELKKVLKNAGLPVSGTKEVLIQRLKDARDAAASEAENAENIEENAQEKENMVIEIPEEFAIETETVEEPAVEPEDADTEANKYYSVDYWWNKTVATMVLKKCLVLAANNSYKKDYISRFMVRSAIFETMTGKRLVGTYQDETGRWVKVTRFSPEKTPEIWQLAEEFLERFEKRYLIPSGDKGYVISSEIITCYYGKARYSYINSSGKRETYLLDKASQTIHLEGYKKFWRLSEEMYHMVDEKCKFVKFFA